MCTNNTRIGWIVKNSLSWYKFHTNINSICRYYYNNFCAWTNTYTFLGYCSDISNKVWKIYVLTISHLSISKFLLYIADVHFIFNELLICMKLHKVSWCNEDTLVSVQYRRILKSAKTWNDKGRDTTPN